MDTLTIARPDDWHVHLRDGAVLRAVLPYTAAVFGRAIVMPNLKPPVVTTDQARAYRETLLSVLPKDTDFAPLMTLYLTNATRADDVEEGVREGIVKAIKFYPANATTNSEFGVSDIKGVYPVLDRMQRLGLPLLMHGEVVDPMVDIFDREAVFIERVLQPLRRDFPELKMVMEHITTETATAYVSDQGLKGFLAATITAHHLHINRNAILAGGLHPHYYCLPVAKREKHRQALIRAATSGQKMFFLGTDSAPHVDAVKECACGCAGIFTAPNAMGLYAQIFDDAGKLENLEAFASRNGPAFYGLPVNEGRLVLKKEIFQEIKPILTEEGQKLTPFVPPSPVLWRAV